MTAEFKSQRSETVLTPEVRIAYPFIHEKRTKRANGLPLKTPRYDMAVLFPKLHADPQQCANYLFLWRLINEAATKSWGGFPAGGHLPIQDGDAPPKPKAPTVPGQAPTAAKEYPWRKGHWIIEVTNYLDPGPRVCVSQAGQVVEIPSRSVMGKTYYKSGDYGIVSLSAYTFQNEKFGVNFGFEGVLWTREGEPIGSSGPKSAAQMFGSIAPAAPAPAAPVAAPPQMQSPPTAAPVAAPVAPQMQYAAPVAPVAPAAPGMAPLPPLPPGR